MLGDRVNSNYIIDYINENEYKKIINAFKDNRRFFKLKDESFVDLKDEEVIKLLNLIIISNKVLINNTIVKIFL